VTINGRQTLLYRQVEGNWLVGKRVSYVPYEPLAQFNSAEYDDIPYQQIDHGIQVGQNQQDDRDLSTSIETATEGAETSFNQIRQQSNDDNLPSANNADNGDSMMCKLFNKSVEGTARESSQSVAFVHYQIRAMRLIEFDDPGFKEYVQNFRNNAKSVKFKSDDHRNAFVVQTIALRNAFSQCLESR